MSSGSRWSLKGEFDPEAKNSTFGFAYAVIVASLTHTVLTNAVSLETLEDFARMARVEHIIIDEDTKIRDFRRELQWTAAYHRFAERI